MRFKELSLAVGEPLAMRMIGLDYKKHQLDTRLMGYVEGKNLMVTLHSKPGQILLQPGQAVSLEAKLPLGQVQFETEIERIYETPFLYLMLDYPLGVNFQQQRKYERVPVDVAVEVIGHTGLGMVTGTIHGHMLDVSVSGARLVLEKEITVMVTKLSLGVMLSSQGLERDMTVSAKVRKLSTKSDDHPECGFAYGVEFINLDLMNELFLRSFCLQEVRAGQVLLCS